jgi:alginate O-acetyltransferase complex protein AlgI
LTSTAECVRRNAHLGLFALYVAFFPQLVAGPIERSTRLLPQFLQKFDFVEGRVVSGLRLMLWGMFKKVVIADRLAILVDCVFSHLTLFSGFEMIVATFFFAVQIYCDFSGYSDIAIGSARVLGFKLMDNFKAPYLSQSIPEFWQRWHISLSTWFRDYLYIPLGGSRVREWRIYVNVFIVFLLSGLWHGANWTFVIWGALHGAYFLLSRLTRPYRERAVQRLGLERWPALLGFLRQSTTFILVCFAWIFFRANTVGDAFYVVTHLFSGWGDSALFDEVLRISLFGRDVDLLMTVMLIVMLWLVDIFQDHPRYTAVLFERSLLVSWGIYLGLCLYIMNYGIARNIPFIYFQF